MTPDNIKAVAEGLTPTMQQALADFDPGVWHGATMPTRRASTHKGHAVRMGLIEHNGAAPISAYRLTPLGEAVRVYLQQETQP